MENDKVGGEAGQNMPVNPAGAPQGTNTNVSGANDSPAQTAPETPANGFTSDVSSMKINGVEPVTNAANVDNTNAMQGATSASSSNGQNAQDGQNLQSNPAAQSKQSVENGQAPQSQQASQGQNTQVPGVVEEVLTESVMEMEPAMPGGIRPETMKSQKVKKDIKLPRGDGKRSHKGLIITIVITLVLAAGAGAAWWFMAGPGKTVEEGEHSETHWPCTSEDPGLCLNGEESNANEGPTEVEITPEEEERRVREVVEMMRARAEEFLKGKGITDIILTEIEEGSGIYVRPDGWGAAVGSTKAIGYSVADRTSVWELGDASLEADNVAQALLEENGFQNYGFMGAGYGLEYNPETGVYCAHEAGMMLFDFSCAYKTWVDENQKEMVNQMAAGYLAGMGQEVEMISINMANLENSPVSPYQRIWVTIPGAAADYYRVSPESEWKFFRAGQDAASCEDYSTDELKNAYAGRSCYSASGEGIVEAAS